MNTSDLQFVSIIIAAGAALLNIILIPLVKSAARGEAGAMFNVHNVDQGAHLVLLEEHNVDENAHPNLTVFSKVSIQTAITKAEEAARAADRAETATLAFRKEIFEQLTNLSNEVRARPPGHPAEISALRTEVSDLRVAIARHSPGRSRGAK